MISLLFAAVLVTSESAHTVDFGPDATAGYATFTVKSVAGTGTGAVVRVAYANHPDMMTSRGDFWHETRAKYLGKDVLLPIPPSSTDRYELFTVKGPCQIRSSVQQGLVRYARISVDTSGAKVAIDGFKMENRATYSDERVVGSFSCSDARLDALWKASVRTCQLSAIPKRGEETLCAYLSDGAKRDRLVWSGDLWWADINMYAAYASTSPYMPGSLRMLALAQTPEGYVQACPYPETKTSPRSGDYGPFASDEFAAWFVPVLRNYALYTGDLKLTRELYPTMVRLVDYLGRHTKDGLFIQRKETSKNAGALRFGSSSLHHRSYMQILLWKTLSDAVDVAVWLKEDEFAARCRAQAEKIAAVTRQKFRHKDGVSYIFSLEKRVFSPDANALALATEFVSAADAAVIASKIRRIRHGKFQALAARGRFAYGFGNQALKSLEEHNFFTIIDPAWKGCRTTHECMNVKMAGWGDEAHPDTAVAGILTAYVLGVRPVSPGYETFVFDPAPPDSVSFAKGVIPTPKGLITVEWHRENGKIVRKLNAPNGINEVTKTL